MTETCDTSRLEAKTGLTLVLVRHGNTFGPEDRVVWVGARSDMPLVHKGKDQAQQLGKAFAASRIKPDTLIYGPLQRTTETAEILADHAGWQSVPRQSSEALREIDYGVWEGKSNDEIIAQFGPDEITRWQKDSIWPDGFDWHPKPDHIAQAWAEMIGQIEATHGPDATAVIVTSNGILRLIAEQYGIAPRQAKVLTGHFCVIEAGKALCWNHNPAEPCPPLT
ncbi:histidine phosphatase family protein [Celeribacter naphthalenivorans]|uniref:histidine phosphatase family protein n=1 Tax=Celeribacter naphthalenivorans TaxID=1614694 RepID=UPI001CF95ACC|nr:histidine phosphatase family protein [Celeribacter naphthalenivorans]